jgi:uncharacterized membrane protein
MISNFKSGLIDLKSSMIVFFKNYAWTILILLVFATLYSLVSLVNHYNFRTYAFDLGIYNNAIYDYSKFQVNNNPVMHIEFNNILSDHFSLLLIFFAPLRYLFGSWTLLLIQIFSILFGGMGTYFFVKHITNSKWIANLALIHFLSSFAIFSALSFDYHDNVVGAMIVPWVLLSFYKKQWRSVIIFSILVLISKENMSLWLSFVFAGLFLLKFKDKPSRRFALGGSIISIAYFMLIMGVVMPSLANEGKSYGHMKYDALGKTYGEILANVFERPKYLFSLLFENHGDATYDGIKTELHYVVLLSGGIALLYKPQFLIMLLPIYAQKLFHNSYVKWGINIHYSIEFTAILTIALFVWIIGWNKNTKYKSVFIILFTIISLLVSFSVLDRRKSKWYSGITSQVYKKKHYVQLFDVKKVHQLLDSVPDEVSVVAQNNLVPYLAFREKIYVFPYVRDAEYIALLPSSKNYYPLKKDSYEKKLDFFKNHKDFKVVIDDKDFVLIKRISNFDHRF